MKDRIVQLVIEKFQQRSEAGIKKYGTTLEQNNDDDYLNHLQEELMDAILYIQKLKTMNNLNPLTSNPKRAESMLARDILAQIPEYVKEQYKLKVWEHYPNTLHFSHGKSSGTIPLTEDTSLSIDYDIKNPDEVFCLCIHTLNRYFISLTPSLDTMSISMWLR